VLPLLFPPERYGEARSAVAAGAERVGRSADSVDVAACVWCSVAEDRGEARRSLALKLAYFGPSFSPHVLQGVGLEAEDMQPSRLAFVRGDFDAAARKLPSSALRLGIEGNADDVVERLGALLELGATHISFGPPLGPNHHEALEILRTGVIPQLRHAVVG
jgi:5,10-methylenetetrahydromethanopterin reductase